MARNFSGFVLASTEAGQNGMMSGLVPASTIDAALP